MGNCCYYLCLCGCCDLCYRKQFVKLTDIRLKVKNLQILEQLTPIDLKRVSSGIDPNTALLLNLTEVHNIPNDQFQTEQDVIQSYGYKFDKYINSGKYGKVYGVIHVGTGYKIACKVIVLPDIEQIQNKQLNAMKNELHTLQGSIHPNIIKLIEHFIITNKVNEVKFFIFMQFAKNGTLSSLTEKHGPFDEDQCKIWFAQMLSALNYMHEKGLAHRDMKLQNILLDEYNDVLISDFGMSLVSFRSSKGGLILAKDYCGTPPFMAPEVLIKKNADEEEMKRTYNPFLVDVWALGVILYRLFNKDYPFDVDDTPYALKMMRLKKWNFSGINPDQPSDYLRAILKKMFEPNPFQRPTVEKLTKHVWIRDVFREIDINNYRVMQFFTNKS